MEREIWTHTQLDADTQTQAVRYRENELKRLDKNEHNLRMRAFFSFFLGRVINQDNGIEECKREKRGKKTGFNGFTAKQSKVLFISCAFIHVFGLSFFVYISDCCEFFKRYVSLLYFLPRRCQTSFSTPGKQTSLSLLSVRAIDQNKLKYVYL